LSERQRGGQAARRRSAAQREQAAADPRPRRTLVCGVALFVVVALTYADTLRNGFAWDDEAVILGPKGEGIRSIRNLPLLFSRQYFKTFSELSYRPVVTFTYFIDHGLYRLEPWGYHLGNLLLHAAAAIALFLALDELLGRQGVAAWAGAAFFAVHPVNAEAVNAIGFREDLLCGLFYFLSLWAYLRWRRGGRGSWAGLSWGAFLLAIYAKEMAASLPLVIVAYEALLAPRRGQRPPWLRVRAVALNLVPFVVLIASVLLLRAGGFREQAAKIPYWGGSLGVTLQNVPRALVRYIAWIVMPAHLHVERNLHIALRQWHAEAAWCAVAAAAIIVLTVWAVRRARLAGFGALFFLLALAPVSNVIPLRYFLADRFLYIPLAGACVLVAVLVRWVWERRAWGLRRWPVAALGVLVMLALAVQTVHRSGAWRDQFALWSATRPHTPRNYRVIYQLAVQYGNRGQLRKAIRECRRALQINRRMGPAHFKLGELHLAQGSASAAARDFRQALFHERTLPQTLQQRELMLAVFQQVAAQPGGRFSADLGMALLHLNLGDRSAAKRFLDEAAAQAMTSEQQDWANACAKLVRGH